MGTEEDIFASATADPPQAETPTPEAAAPEPQQTGQEPAAAESAAPQDQPAQPQHQVPLAELLNTRERAQKAERELEDARRAIAEIQRHQQAAQQQRQPQGPPDQFQDPEGYTNWIRQDRQALQQTVEQHIQALKLDWDERFARMQHGDLYDEAQKAFLEEAGPNGFGGLKNPALVAQVMASQSPNSAVVDWYKREKTLKEFGSDPSAYKQKLRQELLADEAFRSEVIEAIKSGVSAQPQGQRPQNVTRLPSLNRQASAASQNDADLDGSEEAIFRYGSRR